MHSAASSEAEWISNAAGKCHVICKQQPSRARQSLRSPCVLSFFGPTTTSIPLSLSLSLSLSLFPSRGLLTSDSPSQIIPMQSNRVLLCLSSQGRHSTAKTCFVPFNLFHWGRKPTVTLSFASDAVGLPRGPNVRLHHAVLVILPKYSSSGISGCRRKFTVSHTWPLVGHCLRPWEVVKIELIVNSYHSLDHCGIQRDRNASPGPSAR